MKLLSVNALRSFLYIASFFAAHSVFAQQQGNFTDTKTTQGNLPEYTTRTWGIRLPESDIVSYRGVVNPDMTATGGGSMIYPAPNLVGFLAAVVTHGVLNETTKSNQKSAIEKQADAMLSPYQEVLKTFRHQDLVQRALDQTSIKGSKLLGFTEKLDTEWVIETNPVFMVTQDESALILDNAIAIYQVGTEREKAFQTVVRVISLPQKDATLSSVWMVEKGAKMKEESASLFARSVDIALSEVARSGADDAAPYKTVRYQQGSIEKMERAKVINEGCNRMLIKTLRGTFMSVPVKSVNAPDAATVKCV